MNIFTTAREAVWDAIDHYGPLQNTFLQKYRYESSARARTRNDPEPPDEDRQPSSIADCPAILIVPSACSHKWLTNQSIEFAYRLAITVWGELESDGIEGLLADLTAAFYTAKPPGGGTQSYIRAATNGQMPLIENWTISSTLIGSPDAEDDNKQSVMMLSGGITLPLRYQPTNHTTNG